MSISNAGLITWTPLEGVLTSGLVTIKVEDSIDNEEYYTVYEQFMVTVIQVNDAPIITSVAPVSVFLGELYSYTILVEDPDDDQFTYQISGYPNGMVLNDNVVSWNPTEDNQIGPQGPITVTVSDGGEDGAIAAIEVFMVEVQYNYLVANYDLYEGNNLISFYSIPPNNPIINSSDSLNFVFDSLGSSITNLFGEGQFAQQHPIAGWIGSLERITPEDGYWVRVTENAPLDVYGLPTGNVEYTLHEGANLISYSQTNSQSIEIGLPVDVQSKIYAIFGQNISALNINGMWFGSLSSFEPGRGYWYIATEPFIFEYNEASSSVASASNNILAPIPSELEYYQSTNQVFYFIQDLNLNHYEIESDDWIVAFNGADIVGARQWNGSYTDIPVMGYDGGNNNLASDRNTDGFCRPGDVPVFKLFKSLTGEYIDLESSQPIPEWQNNQVFLLSSLADKEFPYSVELHAAYPNPFNPSTTISYEVPFGGSDINLSIYDIMGRRVDVLVNDFQQQSVEPYAVKWNAENMASGIYFVRLLSGDSIQTQKIMLIK